MSENRVDPPRFTDELWALSLLVALAGVALPFMMLGALYAHRFRRVIRPPLWVAAIALLFCLLVVASALSQMTLFAWCRALVPGSYLAALHIARIPWQDAAAQSPIEFIAGPPFYAAVAIVRQRVLAGSIRYRHEEREAGRRKVEGLVVEPGGARHRHGPKHPVGCVRLGHRLDNGRAFDVPLAALGVGGALIGQPGMGKTVLLAHLVDGILASAATNPAVVVVLDGKEDAGLRNRLAGFAEAHGVAFSELSSGPASASYDPIGGSAPEIVTAKILSTMDFGLNAVIYREIGAHLLVLIIAALQEVKEPVTLPRIRDCLTVAGLLELAGSASSPELRALATAIGAKQRSVQYEAMLGMYHRLARLLASKYGGVLTVRPQCASVSLGDVSRRPGVLYVGVSTHGGGEDARLLVNVILSDLGELARQRNSEIASGDAVLPIYLFVDEFAQVARGGSEAETAAAEARLSNTFELARSSRISPIPAMQVIPKTEELLSDVFGSGLLVVLRTAQAEEVSKRLGTVPGGTITHKLGSDGHASAWGEGTLTPAMEWSVSPDTLRRAAVGVAMVRLGNAVPVAVLLEPDGWAPRPSALSQSCQRLLGRLRRRVR